MTLSLREGLSRIVAALDQDSSAQFVVRIITHSKLSILDPSAYAFCFRLLSVRTASIGLSKPPGQATISRFKEAFNSIKVWTCFLPITKQFLLS